MREQADTSIIILPEDARWLGKQRASYLLSHNGLVRCEAAADLEAEAQSSR